MEASLRGISKKYQNRWIFRDLDLDIGPGQHHVIVGKNGSGKSTLLMILAGHLSPSKGSICWKLGSETLAAEKVFEQVAICSPYLELIEEFSLAECIGFQQSFKPFRQGQGLQQLLELSGLEEHAELPLKNFSSGMKQRCRLLLAIMSQARLLLLDEPCANLDPQGVQWYQQMLGTWCQGRSVVICSNHNPQEYLHGSEIYSLS